MRVVSAAQMRELDREAIEDYGIPGLVLMENAGLKVIDVVKKVYGDAGKKKIVIFAGRGNNGGDGLVVARHLFNMKSKVKVFLLAKIKDITGDARVNLNIWHKMGQRVLEINENDLELNLEDADLIIDAIFGTGFKGAAREPAASVIQAINASGRPVIAVDIPSGLEADSGLVYGPCVRATHTVTFGLPKLGLVQEPGASYVGRLHVADISIPSFLLDAGHLKRHLLTREKVREWLPERPAWVHKGNCGRVLVVAGSLGMTGAACLAAEAAARAGAGLVTLAVPEGVQKLVAEKLTEVMTVALPETPEKTLSKNALNKILDLAERMDVIALGPGITTNHETASLVRELLPLLKIPCILDADGINCLAGYTDIIGQVSVPLILTPHPGEMGRLIDKTAGEVQQNRLTIAEQKAKEWQTVIILKGATTLITSPDGAAFINPTGNPGMATGGSGDVLTGAVTGLLAQGMDALHAAAAGVYIHGLAGDKAVQLKGLKGVIAGDILTFLPEAIKEIEGQ